jgi:hypothetical protein
MIRVSAGFSNFRNQNTAGIPGCMGSGISGFALGATLEKMAQRRQYTLFCKHSNVRGTWFGNGFIGMCPYIFIPT